MFRSVKQVRAAVSLVNPESMRSLASRPVTFGLVAASNSGYAEMEDYLLPADVPHFRRVQLMENLHRAGDAATSDQVDIVLYEQGLPCPDGAFQFNRNSPRSTVSEILRAKDDLALPLARQYPAFRTPVIDKFIHTVSAENTLFAIATALPNIVPNLFELPWAVGEFASDTAFLTINQIRMAFLIAGASDKEIGFSHQKAEILSIGAGAFGWRALARELVGKIPLGGGLIPKGAIAYAGTFVLGKGLQHYHNGRSRLTKNQHRELYQDAYGRGKLVAESLSKDS
jgi:hypothetical protein